MIQIELVEGGTMPAYQTPGAAAMDCYAREVAVLTAHPQIIPLGFRIALPEGWQAEIRPRSGLATRGVMVANAPGTIDSDYRGEVGAILYRPFGQWTVEPGERVCQMVITRAERLPFRIVDALPETARGASGFGSTGRAG